MKKKVTIYKEVSDCTECPFYSNGGGHMEPICRHKDGRKIYNGEITSTHLVPDECPFRPRPKDKKICKGKIVKIIDTGQSYTTYDTMAKKLKVVHWDRNYLPPVNDLYEIKGIMKNDYDYNIVYIENKRTKKGYLIGIDGIEEVFDFFVKKDEFEIK